MVLTLYHGDELKIFAVVLAVFFVCLQVADAALKPLYLGKTNSMSRTPDTTYSDGVAESVLLTPGTSIFSWTLTNALSGSVSLPSQTIPVRVWLASSGSVSRSFQLTVSLIEVLSGGAVSAIGSPATLTVNLPAQSPVNPLLSTFNIALPATRTLGTGSVVRLDIQNNDASVSARLYQFQALPDTWSRVELTTPSVISVVSTGSFGGAFPGGSPKISFTYGESVFVQAVVSDPFGAYDISEGSIIITDSASQQRASGFMAVVATNTAAGTRTFEYLFNVPAGANTGVWTIVVTSLEGTEVSPRVTATQSISITVSAPTVQGTDPFTCDSSWYIVTGSTAGSQLYRINRDFDPFRFDAVGNPTTTAGGYSATFSLNGLGYNPVDNFQYALIVSSTAGSTSNFRVGQLVKITVSGAMTVAGTLSTTLTASSISSGAFLTDGRYVMGSGNRFTICSISTFVCTTPVTVTGASGSYSFTDLIVNPQDPSVDRIYFLNEAGSNRLTWVSLTTGVEIGRSSGTLGVSLNYGSQFYDSFGTAYFRSNSNSNLYRVNPSSGAAELLTAAPSGGTHDGSSCIFALEMTKVVR